jgi:hypothetical protein
MRPARGSKGREAQRIKPSVALLFLAVEAAAGLDVARDPGVERRDLEAVTPALTPITNGRQGSFDEAARAPRPMPNPAPTSVRTCEGIAVIGELLMQQSSRVFVEEV